MNRTQRTETIIKAILANDVRECDLAYLRATAHRLDEMTIRVAVPLNPPAKPQFVDFETRNPNDLRESVINTDPKLGTVGEWTD